GVDLKGPLGDGDPLLDRLVGGRLAASAAEQVEDAARGPAADPGPDEACGHQKSQAHVRDLHRAAPLALEVEQHLGRAPVASPPPTPAGRPPPAMDVRIRRREGYSAHRAPRA